jgi:glycosyltransferase involved in cell wall biosynthesis
MFAILDLREIRGPSASMQDVCAMSGTKRAVVFGDAIEVDLGSGRLFSAPSAPKRIAMLHPAFDRPGVAEDNVAAFSEALIERGWSVEIITARWNPGAFEGRLDRFKPRLVPRPRAGLAGDLDRRSLAAIADAISDCDIAMAHNYPFSAYLGLAPVALPKIWYCQEPQRRIHALETSPGLQRAIATRRLDLNVAGNRELGRALRVSSWMRRLNPRYRAKRVSDLEGVRGIDAVWANSAATAAQFRSIYGRPADVCHMAVDIPETLPPAAPLAGPIRILTMGGFDPVKGFGRLLRGFEQFCLFRSGAAVLEVAGSVAGQARFEAEVAKQGLSDSVRFHGRLTSTELGALRKECHAFAAAPVDEPFGLVFAEAAAAGLVMIAPDHGGPREITLDGRAGILIDIFDPLDIAAAFARLSDLSPCERERLRQSAFDATKARFDRAQLGARLAGHLHSLLSRRPVE